MYWFSSSVCRMCVSCDPWCNQCADVTIRILIEVEGSPSLYVSWAARSVCVRVISAVLTLNALRISFLNMKGLIMCLLYFFEWCIIIQQNPTMVWWYLDMCNSWKWQYSCILCNTQKSLEEYRGTTVIQVLCGNLYLRKSLWIEASAKTCYIMAHFLDICLHRIT